MDNQPKSNPDHLITLIYIGAAIIISVILSVLFYLNGTQPFLEIGLEILAIAIAGVFGFFFNKIGVKRREEARDLAISNKIGDKVKGTFAEALGNLTKTTLSHALITASRLLENCKDIRVMGTSRPRNVNDLHRPYFESTIKA